MTFKERVIIEFLRAELSPENTESMASAAKYLGISAGDYDAETHFPVLCARRSQKRAEIFVDEIHKLVGLE